MHLTTNPCVSKCKSMICDMNIYFIILFYDKFDLGFGTQLCIVAGCIGLRVNLGGNESSYHG